MSRKQVAKAVKVRNGWQVKMYQPEWGCFVIVSLTGYREACAIVRTIRESWDEKAGRYVRNGGSK